MYLSTCVFFHSVPTASFFSDISWRRSFTRRLFGGICLTSTGAKVPVAPVGSAPMRLWLYCHCQSRILWTSFRFDYNCTLDYWLRSIHARAI